MKKFLRLAGLTAGIVLAIACAAAAEAAVVDKDAPYSGEYFIAYNDRISCSQESSSGAMPASLLSGEGDTTAQEPQIDVINAHPGEDGEIIYQLEPRNFSEYIQPPAASPRQFAAPRRGDPQLGDKREFITVNPITNDSFHTVFVLKYKGEYCNIWLEKEDRRNITDEMVAELGGEYDVKIHGQMLAAFGPFYDRDEDGKIGILLYDIQDDYGSSNSYIGGFFMPSDLGGDALNCMDVLHIDTYPSIPSTGDRSLSEVKSTMVHELQHLIEESACIEDNVAALPTWVNEGLSMAAEHMLYGVLDRRIDYYNNDALINTPLADWDSSMTDTLSNYAYSYLFFQYLRTQTKDFTGGGEELYRYIVHSQHRSALCIEQGMRQFYPYISISDLFRNFYIALTLKEPAGLYGFAGEKDFDRVQLRLYDSTAPIDLGNGAAVVKRMSVSGYTPPDINNSGAVRYAAFSRGGNSIDPPAANLKSGVTYQFKTVSLSCAERYATIYYTLDGLEPDQTSLVYTGEPIQLLSNANLKAVTVTSDGRKSPVAEYRYSLTPEDVELYRPLVGSLTKYGTTGTKAQGIIASPDGGMIQVGTYNQNDVGFEDLYDLPYDPSARTKAYLAKYDQVGNIQWMHSFGGEWGIFPADIIALPDGFAVVGATWRIWGSVPHSGDFEDFPVGSDGDPVNGCCAFVAKFDWDGIKQWVNIYPLYPSAKLASNKYNGLSTITKQFDAVAACPDGSLVAVGTAELPYSSGNRHMVVDSYFRDIGMPIIARLDDRGDFLWKKELSLPRGCGGFHNVAVLSDGTIVACGFASQDALGYGDLALCPSESAAPTSAHLVPLLIAFGQNGTILWEQAFEDLSGTDAAAFSYLLPTENGLIASGYLNRSNSSCFALRFTADSSDCTQLWRWMDSSSPFPAAPMLSPGDDGIIAAGKANYDISHYGLTPASEHDVVVLKLDLERGTVLWSKNYSSRFYQTPASGGFGPADMVFLGNRKYAVTGFRDTVYNNNGHPNNADWALWTEVLPQHSFLFTFYDESTPYYKVSGNVGLPGVSIGGKLSDSQGNYTVKVMKGESITLTPTLAGYTFEPAFQTVGPVETDVTVPDFIPKENSFTLHGTIRDHTGKGLPGVTVGGTTTGPDGTYSLTVRPGSTVLLEPVMAGKRFEPATRTLPAVSGDASGLDFRVPGPRYTVSGTVTRDGKGQGGIQIAGTLTAPDGTYSLTVEEGTELVLSPSFQGYEFTPAQIDLGAVTGDRTEQNFTMEKPTFRLQVSPTQVTFPAAKEGYPPQGAVTVTVKHVTGEESCSGLTLSLPEGSPFELSALSADTLAPGASVIFTVKPKAGLTKGEYSATVQIKQGENVLLVIPIAFTVEEAKVPDKPQPDKPEPDKPAPDKPEPDTPAPPSGGGGSEREEREPKPSKPTQPESKPSGTHISYLEGYPDGGFHPDDPMTRAQCATMLARLLEDYDPEGTYAPLPFSDTAADRWFAGYLSFVHQKGVVKGYPDGSFRPDEPMTRGEFATVVRNILKLENAEAAPFSDTTRHWAHNAIGQLAAMDILNGYPDGTFRPDDPISRAEAAKVLNRAYRRAMEEGDRPTGEAPDYSDLAESHWAYYDIWEASVEHSISSFHGND